MSRRAALLSIAFLSLAVFEGCGPQRSSSEVAEPEQRTTVAVDNGYGENVNVYLVSGGMRVLLGDVNTSKRRTFQVPRSVMVGAFVDLRVEADAVSGGSFVSQEVRLFPGDEIKVYLTEHLLRSWITIRPGQGAGLERP